jgi:hypothetical protein
MLFNTMTFIGVDPTAGHKPFAYAALDNDLRMIALGEGRLDDILSFAAGQRQAVIAVCSPRQPNQGVMARQETRQRLTPLPSPGRWVDFRLADYLIRRRNIQIPQTPSELGKCPGWMQMGFLLHRRLDQLGYKVFPQTGADLQVLEVYPHASYTVLLGMSPFSKYSLEGRLQRQLILYEKKIKVSDPMLFFEEITRHRLLRGILPADNLLNPAELDALVAAYTAWMAAIHPDSVMSVGDPSEGVIILPAAELKETY